MPNESRSSHRHCRRLPLAAEPEETESTQPTSGTSPAAAAASYPRWVVLESECANNAAADTYSSAAACRSSDGHVIRVSVRVAAPPAASRICVQDPAGSYATVVAAHGDSVLITVGLGEGYGSWGAWSTPPDYFVYNAGDAAAEPPRPPSVFLLPQYHHDVNESSGLYAQEGPTQRCLDLDTATTGIMRRGEDGLVVASLGMATLSGGGGRGRGKVAPPKAAQPELLLFRHGEWSVTRPAVVTHGGGKKLLPSTWENHAVVSAGHGLMCWVQFGHGLLLCDVFEETETPVLRFVRLPPAEAVAHLACREPSQDVCVTSAGELKFVSVHPRCCCGGSGATHCRNSMNAYTIKTWTMKMDDMSWVMDAMVDATELWALEAYKPLPRVQLAYPIVSMEEPHVIFFIACEGFYEEHGDKTEWLILVDMKSKAIRSVHRYGGLGLFRERFFCPSSVSDYFNSSPSRSDDNGASSVSKSNMGSMPPPLAIANEQLTDNASNLKAAATPEETVLAALKEIPGLAREDMLKAYSILNHDSNGRRFRSLLGLPMDLRKDWLLMEIKASEACSVCSACTTNLGHG